MDVCMCVCVCVLKGIKLVLQEFYLGAFRPLVLPGS